MTVTLFVPDLTDFKPLVDALKSLPNMEINAPKLGYWQATAASPLTLERKSLGLGTALWFSMLVGGYRGRLATYTKNTLMIIEE